MRVGVKLEFGLRSRPPDLKLFTPNAMCSSPCLLSRSILSRTTAIFAYTWAGTDSFIHELLAPTFVAITSGLDPASVVQPRGWRPLASLNYTHERSLKRNHVSKAATDEFRYIWEQLGSKSMLVNLTPSEVNPLIAQNLLAKKQRVVDSTKILLDVAKESADWFPPLKSALGGVNALIKHYEVLIDWMAVAHN